MESMSRRVAMHLLPLGLVVLAALAIALTGLREWVDTPWTGYRAALALVPDTSQSRRLATVAPASPAAEAGIRSGQWLVSVEGHAPYPGPELASIRENRGPGDTLTVEVADARDGAPRELTLTLASQATHPATLVRLAASATTLIAFLGIGVFVFVRRPADLRAQLLMWFSALVGPFYLLLDTHAFRMTLSGDTQMLGAFRICLFALVYGGVSTALLGHFVLVFPRRRPILIQHPELPRLIYGFYVVLVTLAGVSVWRMLRGAAVFESTGDMGEMGTTAAGWILDAAGWADSHPGLAVLPCVGLLGALAWTASPLARGLLRREGWNTLWNRPLTALATLLLLGLALGAVPLIAASWLPEPLDQAAGVFGLLALLMGPAVACFAATLIHSGIILGALVRSYRESGVEERRQIRWPIWGLIVYFVLGTVLAVIQSVFHNQAFVLVPLTDVGTKILAVLVPLSFAFAIARYRLMDIDLVIRKSVAYAGLTGLVGVIYVVLAVGVGGWLASAVELEGRWSTVGAGVLTLALFFPLRSRVQQRLEGWVFRRRQQLPERLAELDRALGEVRQAEELARALAEAVQRGLPNRGVVVLLASGREGLLRPAAKVGDLPEASQLKLALRPDRYEQDLPADHPAPLHAVSSDADGRAHLATQLRAHWLLPLRSGDRLLGLVTLGRPSVGDEVGGPELGFLADVGRRAARRLDELTLEHQTRDLEQARRIQHNLLPRALPELPGVSLAARYLPCEDVGGDYYDVVPLGDDRVAMVIADVSGKGVPAALLMSNCQAAFRSLVGLGLSPAALCARLNDVMARNVAPEQFVTLCYAELDPRAGTLQLVNAGHVRPVMVAPGGAYRFLEVASGLPLGIMPGEVYAQTSLPLSPKEKLLLFTDGVNEAASPVGDRFDEGALQELLERIAPLEPAEGVDLLFDELRRFTRESPADDVTVLVAALA
jgi:serine phosphatase RsbU (regulator of sigma subunit)